MKVYTVDIDSYKTDNSCATYHYSEDYISFEEAQKALEEKFWEFEKSHGLTERDSRYNKNTGTFEEIPDSDYVYTFEVTFDSFCIDNDWDYYTGEIIEKEILNSLPNGRWYFVDTHGLPKEKGTYLISYTTPKGDITAYSYFDPDMRNIDNEDNEYCEGFFDSSYKEYEYWDVYAWTKPIQPASK